MKNLYKLILLAFMLIVVIPLVTLLVAPRIEEYVDVGEDKFNFSFTPYYNVTDGKSFATLEITNRGETTVQILRIVIVFGRPIREFEYSNFTVLPSEAEHLRLDLGTTFEWKMVEATIIRIQVHTPNDIFYSGSIVRWTD